jgi:GntR family transcriptional regulator/MocR family aminotransferase
MRTCYLERRNTLMDSVASLFPETSMSGFEGGMHLVWTLDSSLPPAARFKEMAKARGVGVYPLQASPAHHLRSRPESARQLMLGYPCLDPSHIKSAIDLIHRAVTRQLVS